MDKPQRQARREEQRTADLHGGRVTPASGSGPAVKNDVRNARWSIEVKSTSKMSYSLRRDLLKQTENNALADGRRMAIVLDFLRVPESYPQNVLSGRYVVMSEDDFLEREHRLEQLETWSEIWREAARENA